MFFERKCFPWLLLGLAHAILCKVVLFPTFMACLTSSWTSQVFKSVGSSTLVTFLGMNMSCLGLIVHHTMHFLLSVSVTLYVPACCELVSSLWPSNNMSFKVYFGSLNV